MMVTMLAGCRTDEYNVVIWNVGQREVAEANVLFGGFESGGGIVGPGRSSGHGNPPYPIPATATVEWRTDDGEMHSQEVEVKKLVPKGFRGDIQFEIADDNTVAVQVIPREKIRY